MFSARHEATSASKLPVNVFKEEKQTASRRKRARYNPERREEVKAVRQIRACLRCSLLKLKCNGDAICVTCRDLVSHTHERQVLSFSGCIRTRLAEVGLFEAFIPPPALRKTILAKVHELDSIGTSLGFAPKVTWNLEGIIDEIVAWFDGLAGSGTSKLKIQPSPELWDLVGTCTKTWPKSDYRRMIYVHSLAYTQPTAWGGCSLSIPEMRKICAVASHEVLEYLDRKLKPQSLKSCSYTDIQGLFLMVFGTLIRISYTKPFTPNPNRSNEEVEFTPQDLYLFPARRYHLCQILAHYLVYLGSHLKLPIANHTEQFILEFAPPRWYKRGGDYEDSRIGKDDFRPVSVASLLNKMMNLHDSSDVVLSSLAHQSDWSDESDVEPESSFG